MVSSKTLFWFGLVGISTVVPAFQFAHAQDTFPTMDWSNVGWSAVNNEIGKDIVGARDRDTRPQTSTPSAVNRSFSGIFSSSKSRTRANLAKFVEKSRATDPVGSAKMAQLFASTDIIGMIDQKMQQTYGMRANNVADAYAVWWVSAWMGSKGRSDDATPGQMAIIKRQASNALAATPQFASATDAGKQELAEAMLVQAAMIGDTIDTYQSDPAMLAKARASIPQGAKAMGLDLNTMTLTDEGFVPARKTGAVDGPADTQLADASTGNAPATSDKSPPTS